MDLHVIAPLASPAERAAIDAVLDPLTPAASGWTGGERIDGDLRLARGGHAARSRRDLLLPALHAVQDRIGWISEPALGYICRRLTIPPAEAYGVATFYALLSTAPLPPVALHVCDDMSCRLAGAEGICDDLERELGPAGHPVPGAAATWFRSPCLGQCDRAPAALMTVAGEAPLRLAGGPVSSGELLLRAEEAATGRGTRSAEGGLAGAGPTEPDAARLARLRRAVPQAGDPGLRLLGSVGQLDPLDLDGYRRAGGYDALRKAISLGPAGVVDEVLASGLLGRGGAAFPTGRKWAGAAEAPSSPKYVVCNADEAEPGTFKDRVLLEESPFLLVEAMTIAGFAVGAERGFLYIRGEYPLGEERMAGAIAQARAAGLLGPDVAGAGFAFEIEIRRGGGAYICGEETALFKSIEGERGEPPNKWTRPTIAGLFGRPTVVNNVETLANVPGIIRDGSGAYRSLGTAGSPGRKLFSISGHVARPGVYEVDFGTTLRELIALAGGVPGGRSVRAVNLGGAAGVFVGPEALEMPLAYEAARDAGATLGAGSIVVFDETSDLLEMARRVARFFRDESCGQCVPCRVGTVRQEELLARLSARAPLGSVDAELALLDDLGAVMRDASICGLGQAANAAVASALRLPGVLPGAAR